MTAMAVNDRASRERASFLRSCSPISARAADCSPNLIWLRPCIVVHRRAATPARSTGDLSFSRTFGVAYIGRSYHQVLVMPNPCSLTLGRTARVSA